VASIYPPSTAQDERTIVITREFDAPRALVWKAWTDPKHLAQWWGPAGFSTPGCAMEPRPGGVFRLQMRGPDGAMYPCEGVYREVVAPERVVYVGSPEAVGCGAGLPPNAVVTVTFTEHAGKTTVTIHTRLLSVADRDAAVAGGFIPGWTDSLARLAEYLPNV
jgi:uncharacterized protein YndB with AHSA1/START domain